MKYEIKNRWNGSVIFALETTNFRLCVEAAIAAKVSLREADMRGADMSGADMRWANMSGADMRWANMSGKKLQAMRVFTGLYRYQVWAVLFDDGSRWVRMGCLFKSLDEWETIGIRKSNISEFPDDGSETSEERVRAFEFAKAAALAMK